MTEDQTTAPAAPKKADSLRVFQTDKNKAVGGVWIDVVDDFRVKIARMNNDAYNDYIRTNTGGRMVKKLLTDGIGSKKAQDHVLETSKKATARFILLDWKNLTEGGVEVPYSEAKALELFNSEPDFYDWIQSEAQDIDNFRRDQTEEDAGN